MLAVVAVYGVGLALASAWNVLAGRPLQPAYLLVFGLLALISAVLLALRRAP